MIHQVEVPKDVESLQLLPRVSYQDAFTTTTPDTRSAEQWLRLALETAPPAMVSLVRTVHGALGLRLEPESFDHPIGWSVLRSEPDLCVIGADGVGGGARVISTVGEGSWTITTQTVFPRHIRFAWVFVAPLHRAVARTFMRRAVRAAKKGANATANASS